MDRYRYRPLDKSQDEIRLVSLLPGNLKDRTQITIYHAPFAAPSNTLRLAAKPDCLPHFEALSYTWGAKENSEVAYIVEPEQDGNEGLTLPLYGNLASALRHLRNTKQARVLWIDSLCINQEDILERNEQVKRMVNIYHLASRVVVFLGTEDHDSQHAFSTLQYIGDQLETTNSGRVIGASGAKDPNLWMNA